MQGHVLITGGCGFVGSNLAARLLSRGLRVRIFDSLARPGSERNCAWLDSLGYRHALEFIHHDLRDAAAVEAAMDGAAAVFHLAAQVAVTSSVVNPRHDLEVNVLGTFNVLEAVRHRPTPPLLVFTSTNKVYGESLAIPIVEEPTRYSYADDRAGIAESQPLDFHSPYGCSKGSADQYVQDYGRIYGIPAVVLRMSCIYGPRQFGNEDQGWLAHFAISALNGSPITICGDGKQVRDVLYIDDLLDLCERLLAEPGHAAGRAFNVGGGANNAIAIWSEFGPLLEELLERRIVVRHDAWRPGDQKVYISDTSLARRVLGWQPRVSVDEGVGRLLAWLRSEGVGETRSLERAA